VLIRAVPGQFFSAVTSATPCGNCLTGHPTPYVAFYEVAASVFVVLLLTGVTGEIRGIRARKVADGTPLSGRRLVYVYSVAFVLMLLLVGELFALVVLLHPPATGWEQLIVVICLMSTVPAVPILIFSSLWEQQFPEPAKIKRITKLGFVGMACVLVGIALYLLVVAIMHPPNSHTYHVYGTCAAGDCGLNERSQPTTTSKRLGQKRDGDAVTIVCQARGTELRNPNGVTSTVWDKLTNGAYVTDLYVDTPAVGGEIPACATPSPKGIHSG
jgi:hypothetical protein